MPTKCRDALEAMSHVNHVTMSSWTWRFGASDPCSVPRRHGKGPRRHVCCKKNAWVWSWVWSLALWMLALVNQSVRACFEQSPVVVSMVNAAQGGIAAATPRKLQGRCFVQQNLCPVMVSTLLACYGCLWIAVSESLPRGKRLSTPLAFPRGRMQSCVAPCPPASFPVHSDAEG